MVGVFVGGISILIVSDNDESEAFLLNIPEFKRRECRRMESCACEMEGLNSRLREVKPEQRRKASEGVCK